MFFVFVMKLSSGHGSFSDSKMLNSVVGHTLHSFILVPYDGWYFLLNFLLSFFPSLLLFPIMNVFLYQHCRRISHRTHHQNHGHVENDESWHPVINSLTLLTKQIHLSFLFFSFIFKLNSNQFLIVSSQHTCRPLNHYTKHCLNPP